MGDLSYLVAKKQLETMEGPHMVYGNEEVDMVYC